MKYHPEQTNAEVFVGNTPTDEGIPEHLSTLKTARLGKVAYDLNGKKLPTNDMLPLFIGESENSRYGSIMMARYESIMRGGIHRCSGQVRPRPFS